ncbi:MAG: Leucine rich repeat-containing protein [Bacteroidales bacterium]
MKKKVKVSTAGSLQKEIHESEKYQITDLTLIGELDSTDIQFIREMAGSDVNGRPTKGVLATLDLSGATIVEGAGHYYVSGKDLYRTKNDAISICMFYKCTKLRSIMLPDNITGVGSKVFEGCTGLTGIIIPNNVTSIGYRAFFECSGLQNVTIGNGVISIGEYAFAWCNGLTGITLPDSVMSIRERAFKGCKRLKSITIPNGVRSIDRAAFAYCYKLESITIGSSVESIGEFAFTKCWRLPSVTIPNSVAGIKSFAFYQCKRLTSITIPKSVTSIGGYVFAGCIGLRKFVVSEANAQYSVIDGVLFNKDQNAIIAYPNAKSDVYVIPDRVISIETSAFVGCCDLKEFIVSEENTQYSVIDGVLFDRDKNTLISYPNAKSAIYVIPKEVTSIGESAFEGCRSLVSVTFPDGVTSIRSLAFSGCSGLTKIYSQNQTPPSVEDNTFTYVDKTICKLYVPEGAKAAYRVAEGWKEFANILEE